MIFRVYTPTSFSACGKPTLHQQHNYLFSHTFCPAIHVCVTSPSSFKTTRSALRPASSFPLVSSPIISATFSVTQRTASATLHPLHFIRFCMHSCRLAHPPTSVSVPAIVTRDPVFCCSCGICACPGCTPSSRPASSMLSVMTMHFSGLARKSIVATEGCRWLPSGMMLK